MDILLEIRKLPPKVVRELGQILDYDDQWKDLMGIIPKQLPKDDFDANITETNPAKYNSEHIQIISQGSIQLKKSPTAILIEEWGTSGRPRANLGHLAYLLTKANLFRAADYVSMDLLKKPSVARPQNGLASTIKLEINDYMRSQESANIKIHKNPGLATLLKIVDYPGLDDIPESLLEIDCEELSPKKNNLDTSLKDLKYPFSKTSFYVDSNNETKIGEVIQETSDIISFSSNSTLNEEPKRNKIKKSKKKKICPRKEYLIDMNIQCSEISLKNSNVAIPDISNLLEEVHILPTKCLSKKDCEKSKVSTGKFKNNFFFGLFKNFKFKKRIKTSNEEDSNIPAFSKILTNSKFSKYYHQKKEDNAKLGNICRRNSV